MSSYMAAYGPKSIDYRAIFQPIEIPWAGIVGKSPAGILRVDDTRIPTHRRRRTAELVSPWYGQNSGVIDSEHPNGVLPTEDELVLQPSPTLQPPRLRCPQTEASTLALFYKRNPNPVIRLTTNTSFIKRGARECFKKGTTEADRARLNMAKGEGKAAGKCRKLRRQQTNW